MVTEDGRVAKVLSTPDDPARAVGAAIAAVGDSRPGVLAHGTTVATNALLERRGATVGLLTTRGFADVIEIARQDRPSLYDIWRDRPEPLVPRRLRLELGRGRVDADGAEIEPFEAASVPPVPDDVDAVAVCLLHADLDPSHERAAARVLAGRGLLDVSCSHEVAREYREYERTVTTVVNAYLRKPCRAYLRALAALADEVLVMTSTGGLLPAADAAELPAALLLSGPAGGARAAAAAAATAGFADAVTFDMGGTSTDVCLVVGGLPEPAPGRSVGGFPIRLPALDIQTIGAGGGSIAALDAGGALVVGPRSAGAAPGPACYGRGGEQPTVTDADLVLGRIPADASFGDLGRLDADAARLSLAGAGIDASGVVAVVDAAMEQAVRAVSVERGVDPSELAIVAFGGAGPLHACAIADALGMAAVVVPPRAGVLSAVGVLTAPRQRDLVRSWPTPADTTGLDETRRRLADEARSLVGSDAVVTTAVDCRYAGQSHELTVAEVDAFDEEHRRRNGYARPGTPIEVVALRATAVRPTGIDARAWAAPTTRQPARGPCVLTEPDCTVWVADGWTAEVGRGGSWVLSR